MSYQQIILQGYIARSTGLKKTNNGRKYVELAMPVENGYGENKFTEWFKVQIWGVKATRLAEYLTKGQVVIVRGHLRFSTQEVDAVVDGKEKKLKIRHHSVIVDDLSFCESTKKKESGDVREEEAKQATDAA